MNLIMNPDVDDEEDMMTLRDYFAAAALTGILARVSYGAPDNARFAYEYADAMLKERDRE